MGYAKLFSSICESSLWSEPAFVRVLFVSMLAKADSVGFVEASEPGLARVANLSLEETQQALKALESPDAFSKNPDNEGRRITKAPGGWVIINYEDYRNRRDDAERREYMREYMRAYRKKNVNICKQPLAAVNHSKPELAQAETETEAETTKPPIVPQGGRASPELVMDCWNSMASQCGLPPVMRMTAQRRKHISARIDPWWQEHWQEALEKIPTRRFLIGDNERGWKADFDWFIRPDTVAKLIEGKYENSKGSSSRTGTKPNPRNIGTYENRTDYAEVVKRRAEQRRLEREMAEAGHKGTS